MAGRKVKTASFESISHLLNVGLSTDEQNSLISDLEGSIRVNRKLLHTILESNTDSTINGNKTASQIPQSIAEAMIKENALMKRRLQDLSDNYEELQANSAVTTEKIREVLNSESTASQLKARELSALHLDIAVKEKTIGQLKERIKLAQFEVDSSKRVVMPSSFRETQDLLDQKTEHIRAFKKKLSDKLSYTETRRDQIASAFQQLSQVRNPVQEEKLQTFNQQRPLDDLGYGYF